MSWCVCVCCVCITANAIDDDSGFFSAADNVVVVYLSCVLCIYFTISPRFFVLFRIFVGFSQFYCCISTASQMSNLNSNICVCSTVYHAKSFRKRAKEKTPKRKQEHIHDQRWCSQKKTDISHVYIWITIPKK